MAGTHMSEWIDVIFNWSVMALYEVAGWLDITYEQINVWIFCIIWPLITLLMIVTKIRLWRDNRTLKQCQLMNP
jgi:hypothetical protein